MFVGGALEHDITSVPGVGPKTAEALAACDVRWRSCVSLGVSLCPYFVVCARTTLHWALPVLSVHAKRACVCFCVCARCDARVRLCCRKWGLTPRRVVVQYQDTIENTFQLLGKFLVLKRSGECWSGAQRQPLLLLQGQQACLCVAVDCRPR